MSKFKNMLDRAVEWFSVLLISVMVLLVSWQVFARYILNNPSSFSETLTRYLFVWLVITTATYAFGKRDHMCISYLKDKLPKKAKAVTDILIELLTVLFSSTIMVYGGFMITRMQMVQLDSNLHIPVGVIYSIIPICGVVILFYGICNIEEEIRRIKTWAKEASVQGAGEEREGR